MPLNRYQLTNHQISWTETAKDKQRRDPTVGSTGGGESNSPNSQPSEDPGADHQKQEEIPQSDQPRGGESDSPGRKPSGNPIIGPVGLRQVQVDSRERKLSRVRTGTETSAQGTKCSDKSAWRICQADPKTPPADEQSVQVTQENRKRCQHWHRTHRRYPVQFHQN